MNIRDDLADIIRESAEEYYEQDGEMYGPDEYQHPRTGAEEKACNSFENPLSYTIVK
jgi:hypothetical protein